MSLKEEWEEFSAAVIPEGSPQVQFDEMEKAYYGGAATMFTLMSSSTDNENEKEAMEGIQSLFEEVREFGERMKRTGN